MGVSKGYEGYASLLEHRIITQSWQGHHRAKGKFIFCRIYSEEVANERYFRDTIGFEMRTRGSGGDWIFQCYHDGTAFYKNKKLRSVMHHWQCLQDINEVIDHYYNKDTEIVPKGDDQWQIRRDTITVLRRKPISAMAKSLYAQGRDLGDFLVNKYNMTEEVPA